MRTAKANESEPPMKGRKHSQTMSKPEPCGVLREKVPGGPVCAGMTSGLEAARARNRLRHGTLEPVVRMRRERHKRKTREAKSTKKEAQPPTPGTGTERPVVARKDRKPIWSQGAVSSSSQAPGQSRLVGRGAHG